METRNLSEPQLPQGARSLKMQGNMQLTFIHDKEDIRWLSAKNAARHRHSIFTDVERRDMTLQIVSSVPNQNPDQAITDLERFDSDTSCSEPFALFRGPFGAFRWSQPPPLDLLPSGTDDHPASPTDWFEQLEELARDEDFPFRRVQSTAISEH
ncbi:uncharacterized protein PGRI_023930 [Penicillium griseofulvum]|uniref:Uncharacterized protein n=1 Tax=Penicillium patulum TaxID=5078 RepID=A0A135LHT4_PENPA|nr:uncharacterized protein PGRI_023930 [Penicillium griseofulvum]KXG48523.1 hypothetical protein PGRI_023930 [Penicillium griseofulvum]